MTFIWMVEFSRRHWPREFQRPSLNLHRLFFMHWSLSTIMNSNSKSIRASIATGGKTLGFWTSFKALGKITWMITQFRSYSGRPSREWNLQRLLLSRAGTRIFSSTARTTRSSRPCSALPKPQKWSKWSSEYTISHRRRLHLTWKSSRR